MFKGVAHNQGDTWQDGCDYDCECTDAAQGKYICTERCPRFGTIQQGCSLVPDANDRCCQQVTCRPTAPPATPGPQTNNPGPGGATSSPGSTGSACTPGQGDKLQNCYLYGKQACTGQYVQWAKDNCAEFCGFCQGSTTPAPCEDKIPNCKAYGADSCTGGFTSWAEYNCPKFCGFCGGATTAPAPTSGSSNNGPCTDKLPNCAAYDQSSCSGAFEPWALDNCRKTCNLCNSQQQSVGTGNQGPGTSGTNPGVVTANPNSGTFTGSSAGQCYYKGKLYNQGQTWQDGCQYNCTCKNGNTGFYECNERCPTYNFLPDGCTLQKQPGQCCSTPVCNTPGGTSGSLTGCLYKNKLYTQDQEWDDGCTYKCKCVDGTIGQYQCNDKCINWQLPSVCTLDAPKPGLCCKTPNCPSNVNIQYPPGYVAQ